MTTINVNLDSVGLVNVQLMGTAITVALTGVHHDPDLKENRKESNLYFDNIVNCNDALIKQQFKFPEPVRVAFERIAFVPKAHEKVIDWSRELIHQSGLVPALARRASQRIVNGQHLANFNQETQLQDEWIGYISMAILAELNRLFLNGIDITAEDFRMERKSLGYAARAARRGWSKLVARMVHRPMTATDEEYWDTVTRDDRWEIARRDEELLQRLEDAHLILEGWNFHEKLDEIWKDTGLSKQETLVMECIYYGGMSIREAGKFMFQDMNVEKAHFKAKGIFNRSLNKIEDASWYCLDKWLGLKKDDAKALVGAIKEVKAKKTALEKAKAEQAKADRKAAKLAKKDERYIKYESFGRIYKIPVKKDKWHAVAERLHNLFAVPQREQETHERMMFMAMVKPPVAWTFDLESSKGLIVDDSYIDDYCYTPKQKRNILPAPQGGSGGHSLEYQVMSRIIEPSENETYMSKGKRALLDYRYDGAIFRPEGEREIVGWNSMKDFLNNENGRKIKSGESFHI